MYLHAAARENSQGGRRSTIAATKVGFHVAMHKLSLAHDVSCPPQCTLHARRQSPALEKARTLAVDGLIFDLEDSVAPVAKAEARVILASAITTGGLWQARARDPHQWSRHAMGPRGHGKCPRRSNPTPSSFPSVNRCTCRRCRGRWPAACRSGSWIETPLSILNIREIAEAVKNCGAGCLVLGTNDLVKDSRMRADNQRAALLPALSLAVFAARAPRP